MHCAQPHGRLSCSQTTTGSKAVPAAVDGDADTEAIRDWQATLLQGQFLLESRVALKQQALQNSWVQACLRPDLQLQNPLLGSFVQAFMH